MNDLFKKLNLLVKSGINDVIGDDTSRRAVDPRQLGKDLSKEVDTLRSRVNDAIAHEESLQKQVETLATQIEQLDRAADIAVKEGKEQEAKHILSQMQFAQQRLTMAQADLEEHQLVTADLIRRVNLLDTVVSEAKGQQADENASSNTVQESMQQRMNTLSDMLKTARDKVSASISSATHGERESEVDSSSRLSQVEDPEQKSTAREPDSSEDDFEARLQRLSKPKKP